MQAPVNQLFKFFLLFFNVLFLLSFPVKAQDKTKKELKVSVVGFYNLENLYDTIDDPLISDEEYLPDSPNNWNTEKYFHKLKQLSYVIAQMGTDASPDGLAVLGVAEVENRRVLEDLVKEENIKNKNFQIVHYDGPDRRGVDVAFLYNPSYFKLTNSKSYTLTVVGENNFRTRDQLVVSGTIDGEKLHFIVAHWPSRRGGEKRSRHLRVAAARLGQSITDSLYALDPGAKIIYMGDLNDDPATIQKYWKHSETPEATKEGKFFNPFIELDRKGVGTLAWRDTWTIFDQHFISYPLVAGKPEGWQFYRAKVFNKKSIAQQTGRFAGYPFRTYAGGQYQGGFSDHFPSYVILIKEAK
jgi:hypothetical protein